MTTQTAPPRAKDPAHVRAGVAGSAARWGTHGRLVRLSELDDVTRGIITAILDGRRAMEKATAAGETPAAAQEADGGTRRRSPAA